jgi:hypothetical protein
MSRQNLWAQRQIKAGNCGICGKPRQLYATRCDICAWADRERQRKRKGCVRRYLTRLDWAEMRLN